MSVGRITMIDFISDEAMQAAAKLLSKKLFMTYLEKLAVDLEVALVTEEDAWALSR